MTKFFNIIRFSKFTVFFKKLINKFKKNKNEYILARVACMGKDVLKILDPNIQIINIQKGRIDLLNKFFVNDKLKPQMHSVHKFICRNDVISLIEEQYLFTWNYEKKPPKYIFMDSYSELTDQLFVHKKKKWMFCSNYSDINHSEVFNKNFSNEGLLDISFLKEHYMLFFDKIRKKFPFTPIIFLHFPTKLDTREKFRNRFEEIKYSIESIKDLYEPFYSISIDEQVIDWPSNIESKSFPYHFNQETYDTFAREIGKII
jgi:hypothetical protein